jgi:lipoyl(octanoyl) transferase
MARKAMRDPVPYEEAEKLQRRLVERRAAGEIPDVLCLLEHPPTITWGSSGGRENVLLRREELEARGIALCPSERGGNVTFHAPGQLVGYPIVELRGPAERDLHAYLRALERGLISLLAGLGVRAEPVPERTGVWVPGSPPRKIAAIGVRASRWITSHGFALNVENSLEGFALIVPCGLSGASVTSLARELGPEALPAWDELAGAARRALEDALGRKLEPVAGTEARRLAAGGARADRPRVSS